MIKTIIILLILLSSSVFSSTASAKVTSLKTSNKTCGSYTIQLKENGFAEPADQLHLIFKGKTVLSLKAAGVGISFCKDITADGIPEIMFYQYSGGTRCCYTHSLYSLPKLNKQIKAPKLLFYSNSKYTKTLKTAQLDASPALEIISSDWRFAYKYGVGISESLPMPVIYSFHAGRYMDLSRHYQSALRRMMHKNETAAGHFLINYAILTQIDTSGEAKQYADSLPEPERSWLQNYAPDIKQALSNYGMSDWPRLTVLPKDVGYWGLGGAFSAPNKREFFAMSREGARSGFYLYKMNLQTKQATRFGPFLTTSMPPIKNPKDRTYNLHQLPFVPRYTVRRANQTDDIIIEDKRKGKEGFQAYRLIRGQFQELENDALTIMTQALYDLTHAARQVGQQYKYNNQDIPKKQKVQMQAKRKAALAKAEPWFKLSNIILKPQKIGKFEVSAIELTTDEPHRVTAIMPVSLSIVTEGKTFNPFINERATIQMELNKNNGQWQLQSWHFTERAGEIY